MDSPAVYDVGSIEAQRQSNYFYRNKNQTMKKLILPILIAVVTTLSMSAQRFAVVDIEYVLNRMPEYEQAQSKLDQQAAVWRQEIAHRYDEIKGLYNKYQAEQVLLSDTERQEREEQIVEKERVVRELQKQKFGAEGELFAMRQELVAPVQDRLYSVIEDYSTQRGYDFIFDKGGSVGIIFANPEFDKTDEILTRLKLK